MKAKHVILYLLLAIVSFSCIGEEALNAEADILSCALPGAAMNVCSNQEELERFLQLAANVSKKHRQPDEW